MKKNLLFVFTFLSMASFGQEIPSSFTLDEAIEWGLNYNRTLQRASLELQKAHKEKWKTIAIGFPQINANLQYQNNIELPVSLIPAEFFGGTKGEFAEVSFGTEQTAMAVIELNQLIFDGTYVVGLQGIRHYIETAENVLKKTQLEIKKAIITSYVNCLVTHENIGILQKNTANLKNDIEEAHQLFINGFTEEETVEQLSLTLSSLNTQLQYAKKSAELADNILKLLLGMEVSESLSLSNELAQLTTYHLVEDRFEDYSNNIDIRLAENEVTSESLLYRLERAKSLPSFSAFVNGMYMGNSNSFSFTKSSQKWFGSSAFGLRVKIPVFSSFRRSASAQKVKLTLMQAETFLIEKKAEIYVRFKQAQNDYDLAKENYATALENQALSERIKQKNTTKFFEGLASSFELRQAQLQLFNSQQNVIQSMRQVIISKSELDILINNPQ